LVRMCMETQRAMQTKITKSARGRNCTIRLANICNFNPETTVLAHISGIRFRKGIGNKVSDALAAFSCSGCHDAIDGRIKTPYTSLELKMAHYEGVLETQIILMDEGLLICK
jgi:hypothetical protein